MKKIELFIILSACLSILLKTLHIPFSGELLTISIMILANYYFLYYLAVNQGLVLRLRKFLFKEVIVDSIEVKISGFALPLLLIAILFKLQHYPFWPDLFIVGLTVNSIGIIITGYKHFKLKSIFFYHLFIRLVIIGAIAFIIFMMPIKNSNINVNNSDDIELHT
ncbi:hypothetical protein L3049_06945 [Labilibaculum sp. DW002]|uniref:Uncharacterized protein n=1 Tax=Paralabilibaculum antarcticum TaxID=2912572 RepID=A0ABT5VQN8_9BACT|nr:hypothetical protein [Labilibaculum sp. DW002]MDE5417741.1 hypothetical protein [Labilibaculum sp. DW002]